MVECKYRQNCITRETFNTLAQSDRSSPNVEVTGLARQQLDITFCGYDEVGYPNPHPERCPTYQFLERLAAASSSHR